MHGPTLTWCTSTPLSSLFCKPQARMVSGRQSFDAHLVLSEMCTRLVPVVTRVRYSRPHSHALFVHVCVLVWMFQLHFLFCVCFCWWWHCRHAQWQVSHSSIHDTLFVGQWLTSPVLLWLIISDDVHILQVIWSTVCVIVSWCVGVFVAQ